MATVDVAMSAPVETRRWGTQLRIAAWIVAGLLLIGLFGRIMTFPLSHDEQIHVAAARLIFRQPLYGALGYNHLPGLPLLLGGIYAVSGTHSLLLAGRLMVFGCWLVTAAVLWLAARHHGGGWRMAVVAMLMLAAGELLGPAGMVTTNNFLPIPVALLGVHLLIVGLDGERIRPGSVFLAGCAIGCAILLKISYVLLLPPVVIAAMIVPRGVPLPRRIRSILLPLAAGGILGGLPILVVFASDPQMLLAHTIRYFTGGHYAYWVHSTAPKAMSVADKLSVAEGVWLSGSSVLAGVLVGTFAWIVGRRDAASLRWWPVALVAAIIVIGAILSFTPTPAFPQYYEPPVPFLILLSILLYGRLGAETRSRLSPLLGVVGALALVMILPRLAPHIADIAHPGRWTGNRIHAEGQLIRAELAARGEQGKVATLQPIVALEGGLPIYREFAAGPFVYRVADYLSPADRKLFATTSPRELPAFLDADLPAAIVIGREAEFDPAFAAYAQARGYMPVATGDPQTGLFIRPVARPAARPDPLGPAL